jgi:Flp pilus assembly pilin Flp
MNNRISRLLQVLKTIVTFDCGAAMVEYLLVVSLISLGATAGEQRLALGINNAYSTITTTISRTLAPHLSSGSGSTGNTGNTGDGNGNNGNGNNGNGNGSGNGGVGNGNGKGNK